MNKNSTNFAIVLALLATALPEFARAEGTDSLLGIRAHFSIGAWRAYFTQSGNNFSTSYNSSIGPGLALPIGMRIGFVYLEYQATWLMPNFYVNSGQEGPTSYDMNYWSILGGNLGVHLGFLKPLFADAFLGVEKGNLGMRGGAVTSFSGLTAKAGINAGFKSHSGIGIGLTLEYRHIYLSQDSGGSIPTGITTGSDVLFAGITTGFF